MFCAGEGPAAPEIMHLSWRQSIGFLKYISFKKKSEQGYRTQNRGPPACSKVGMRREQETRETKGKRERRERLKGGI